MNRYRQQHTVQQRPYQGSPSAEHRQHSGAQFVDHRPQTRRDTQLQQAATQHGYRPTVQTQNPTTVQCRSTPPPSAAVVQRQLTFSGPEDDIGHGTALLNQAYRVGLPAEQQAQLGFNSLGLDAYQQPKFDVAEAQKPEVDGIGSHLLGKIIDDGDVNIFFGENTNDASPTDVGESNQGRSSGGRILLGSGASAIELIHELIHTYHFAFDPWTAEQKNQDVNINGVDETAEEASTVGLGPWEDFALSENAFRKEMGLPVRDKYTGWEEPA